MTDHTRAMLRYAFAQVFPCPASGHNDRAWSDKYVHFTRLLDAEAYLDAAVMLVPEGWTGLIPVRGGDLEEAWLWPASGTMTRGHRATAATPALALLAAIMEAKNDE